MARTVLTAVLIVLLNVLVGCETVDSGKGQIRPARAKRPVGTAPVVEVAGASETDIVEQVVANRQAYRQGLELLVEYYARTGNNRKLTWAKRELRALNGMPQYNYIIEASVAGPGLKARVSIPAADYLFRDAEEFERKAGPLRSKQQLRLALDKYNQLIREHPSSDKIDDAAYKAGKIYEGFKDYTIALLYYQRTYQWNSETIYPARFREGFILDKRLHRRTEALAAYRQAVKAVKREGEHHNWKEFAEKRIRELTKSEQVGK